MSRFDVSRRSFIQATSAFFGGAALPLSVTGAAAAQEVGGKGKPLMAYVGTFSSPLRNMLPTQVDLPPGNGKGIHLFHADRVTGALTPVGVFEMGNSPSCLTVNAARTRLYSANETERGEGEAGSVSSFAISPADGSLKLLNSVSSKGKGPTYVSLHPSGRFLMVANYFGGSVAVLPVREDGTLGEAVDFKQDEGTPGPKKATNAPPGSFAISGHDRTHAHMIQTDAAGRRAFHVEIGLDQIVCWNFDERTGGLSPNEPHHITALPPGDGPRHFAFHPNGRWLYSMQEEASNVVLFDHDPETGKLTSRQTISSLPAGFAGSSFGSEILVSPDGKFVYAGNRLHDSIAIFSVGKTGELTLTGEEWTRGNYPRSFAFDPTGGFLHCCNQRADNVTVFRVNRDTGALAFTGCFAAVGNPSCVVLLELPEA